METIILEHSATLIGSGTILTPGLLDHKDLSCDKEQKSTS